MAENLNLTYRDVLMSGMNLKTVLIDVLESSYEDWLSYCQMNDNYENMCSYMVKPPTRDSENQEYNKLWFNKLKQIRPTYKNYKPNKYYYKKFVKNYDLDKKYYLDENILNGNLENVMDLIDQGVMPDELSMNKAVENGDVELVDYLYDNIGLDLDYSHIQLAYEKGNKDLLRYLFEKQINEK